MGLWEHYDTRRLSEKPYARSVVTPGRGKRSFKRTGAALIQSKSVGERQRNPKGETSREQPQLAPTRLKFRAAEQNQKGRVPISRPACITAELRRQTGETWGVCVTLDQRDDKKRICRICEASTQGGAKGQPISSGGATRDVKEKLLHTDRDRKQLAS